MVISIEKHEFRVPKKAVLTPNDIDKWEKSEAYQDLLGLLLSLNDSVRGKGCSFPSPPHSPVVTGLLGLLDTLVGWVNEHPPVDHPQRYGNKAFRDYYNRLEAESDALVRGIVGAQYAACSDEVRVYLVESVGNSTRIDYGTGHELAFLMFLVCLFKVGALKQEDAAAVVNKVFKRYLELCRILQLTYKMEPAGSQGVWSLDDHQFVPFIWGSAQLTGNSKIAPEMFAVSGTVVDRNAEEFLFMDSIKFILKVKTGPFAEHSNQLWNISGVATWSKINQGLVKMYKAEVLHKFPAIQHVLFGSLLCIAPATTPTHAPPASTTPSGGRVMTHLPPEGTRFPAGGAMRPAAECTGATAMMPPLIRPPPMAAGMREPSVNISGSRMPTTTGGGVRFTPPNSDEAKVPSANVDGVRPPPPNIDGASFPSANISDARYPPPNIDAANIGSNSAIRAPSGGSV